MKLSFIFILIGVFALAPLANGAMRLCEAEMETLSKKLPKTLLKIQRPDIDIESLIKDANGDTFSLLFAANPRFDSPEGDSGGRKILGLFNFTKKTFKNLSDLPGLWYTLKLADNGHLLVVPYDPKNRLSTRYVPVTFDVSSDIPRIVKGDKFAYIENPNQYPFKNPEQYQEFAQRVKDVNMYWTYIDDHMTALINRKRGSLGTKVIFPQTYMPRWLPKKSLEWNILMQAMIGSADLYLNKNRLTQNPRLIGLSKKEMNFYRNFPGF